MNAMRKGGKGKSGGKGGWQDGGKGGWQKGGKGDWGNNKGKGKGQYNLGWNGDGWSGDGYQQASSRCWTLSLNKTSKIEKPPGLGFEILRSEDIDDDSELNEEEYPFLQVTGGKKKVKMPNYSKNSVRNQTKTSWKRVTHNDDQKNLRKAVMYFHSKKEAVERKDLNPFIAEKPDQNGWVRIRGVMDSGASESVAPPEMCPHYDIVPSPGSVAGQMYVSASDDTIPNLGEQNLEVVTMLGDEAEVKYQIADVARPLNAVSEICDAGGEQGQHVVFGRHGGAVINLTTGKQTPFTREDGIYLMELWVKPKEVQGAGFTRQGR